MTLQQKNILLGVTGGIAAYKCAQLVRLLVKEGASVKVVMTEAAREFVTPQTLSVLSKNEVVTDFFDADFNWNNHVHMAEWADLMIVAPLTANTLGKMAHGICDSVLLACYLSARSTVYVAPAMDLDMYQHPTTRENLAQLQKNGNIVIPAESGELASGLSGEGRMAEPENIVAFIKEHLSASLPLYGKKVLVSAGPTYEAIDPVRFIGNRSSGKMGIFIADAFAAVGAEVTLVLGPSAYRPFQRRVQVLKVESAAEMYEACISVFDTVDIAVLSAAVADYRPKEVSDQKIKKTSEDLHIDLVKTRDILATLGERKQQQCLVGFALETHNVLDYAADKLKRKNLDFIIANSAVEEGAGFSGDTNKITIIDKHNKIHNFELKSKREVAKDIVDFTLQYIRHYA